ncbi:hypothetical protein A3A38_03255 [Candidatus Kaiserbacteria bacterium RIFCSPLOWO2_01_FULL_53_17]|uniref:Steroid 5-alpha reductase C-terminal domain-containing protein n=1 Tax=Candidatus Kaiserbacteria bacterium RIFCSPLOWO2_01_FULL_53_17 TaxID=1798511 RepID=A0A1F6EGZ2_9BACT|nr:MAG: hypothetical protein A3A38_03255 [Candidatus Kaiserbacteria bacterium RIFCSPLOWO2_01_FULL_53_17]
MKSNEDSPKVIALPPFIFLGGIIAGFIVDWFFPMPFIPEEYDVPIGVLFILLAVAHMVWAVRTFGKAGTNVDPRQPSLRIVSGGPYRFTRNPMYVSMALIVVGFAVWLNSLWILAALAVVLVVMTYGVIMREEAYLEKKFGRAYLDYKGKVRRWI